MPIHGRAAPAYLAAAMAGGILVAGACGGGRSEPKPVASLASSPSAAGAFEAVRDAWSDQDRTTPVALRAMLEQFLRQFGDDGLVPLARSALALVAMKQGDMKTADAQMALAEGVAPGSAHDLWTVARAGRLRLAGDADAALGLLRPLIGKNVDPLVRASYSEELTLAALACHRDYEAISYMDAWLRATADDDKDDTVIAVRAIVERLPKDVVVGALKAMRARRASFGYGVDIERILGAHLVEIATANGDAELARMLLDPATGGLSIAGNAATTLGELAASRRGLNVVAGRTLGLLLPTESPGLRDEAADVLRGVMWSLGLPRGVRTARSSIPKPLDVGTPPAAQLCGALEPAPELDEPGPKESLRLVTRDDAGSADRTEVSLDELEGEGAAIIVAGLDGQTSARALKWGEAHGVPVIVVVPPPQSEGLGSFGFVLGSPRSEAMAALVRAAPSLASLTVAPVADASEISVFYPAQGGPTGALTLTPPVSCDIPAARAGEPRFPIAQWDHDGTRAWLVSGSPECATDVVAELSAARARGVVALTLEAAALPLHAASLRVLSAKAGAVPAAAADDPRNDEMRRFSTTLGRAGWWAALGRDAAALVRIAVRHLPNDEASDPRAVAERRAAARDQLSSARARLWTTETAGFTAGHAMKRTVCVAEAPAR